MKKIMTWCKTEIVLTISVLLAVVSSFIIPVDKKYVDYIDFRTLAILFCLMAVMAGFQKIGLFRFVAGKLLEKVSHIRTLIFILIMLCFVFGMFITNDVALITFVPFSFIVLKLILGEQSEELVIPIVVMQTIAANLGSMLTPIGNPQNLYLYEKSAMGLGEFLRLMLPYTLLAFLMLAAWCLMFPYKGEKEIHFQLQESAMIPNYKKYLVLYIVLFLLCVFTVAHILPYGITLMLVVGVVFFSDKKIFLDVDYTLLLTFVGFFVFIGNMGRVPAFSVFLQNIIEGNEVITGVAASQFMSNVPAALLLSGFTKEWRLLIVGVNLGGLGTLIASMASLISFKYIGKEYGHLKGKYMLHFTIYNIIFLLVLFLCAAAMTGK